MPQCYHPRQISREPCWRPAGNTLRPLCPRGYRRWLLDDSSLTARLVGLNRGVFQVERRYQGWHTRCCPRAPCWRYHARQRALVREVSLKLGGQTVVFARIFPITSLTGDLAHLRHLQNRSLGTILFKHPGMHRSPFELSLMAGDSEYLPADLRQATPAWGRRSRFVMAGRALMVSEVFLQGLYFWAGALAVHRAQRGKVDAAIVPPTQ